MTEVTLIFSLAGRCAAVTAIDDAANIRLEWPVSGGAAAATTPPEGFPEKKEQSSIAIWYRNPQQPGQSSIGIAYVEDEQYKVVRPDFIFFAEQEDKVVVDLVDPHGLHLADALSKLQGLAIYAESYGHAYRRIESVAEAFGKLRALELKRPEVRRAIRDATSAKGLFESAWAIDYD